MYAQYGDYAFDANEVSFVFSSPAKLDGSGVPYALMPKYALKGTIRIADTGVAATNQANLTAKLLLFEAAIKTQYRDFVFKDDAGNPTVHKLLNSETTGGVRVLEWGYDDSKGAEYTTYRNFSAVIGAEIPDTTQAGNGGNSIIRYRESLTFIGTGGPATEWQEMIEGDPIQQQTAQRTTIRAIQEGSALGYKTWINPPPGLYPLSVERQRERVYRRDTAQQFVNGVETEFPSSWQYVFQFADPSNGNPTGRPR